MDSNKFENIVRSTYKNKNLSATEIKRKVRRLREKYINREQRNQHKRNSFNSIPYSGLAVDERILNNLKYLERKNLLNKQENKNV